MSLRLKFLRWYLKGYVDPHPGLRPMSEGAGQTAGVCVLRVPMPVPTGGKTDTEAMFWKFFAHVYLAVRVILCPKRLIIVREFLTIPMLLVTPVIWIRRKRLWLVNHHNLARARASTVHEMAMRVLLALGFRFIVFEESQTWTNFFGVSSLHQVCSVPFPLPTWPDVEKSFNEDGSIIVGLVGNFRKEKSPSWAISTLLDHVVSPSRNIKLLIGTTDSAYLAEWSDVALTVDTTTSDAYRSALRSCRVVVFPYPPEAYFGRVSGIVAEAIASGCAVVVPKALALKRQAYEPKQVGLVFNDRSEFVSTVLEAISLARPASFAEQIRAHREERSSFAYRLFFDSLCHDGLEE